MRCWTSFWGVVIAAVFLSACGTYVPAMPEPWDNGDPNSTYYMEASIKRAIWCELAKSVYFLENPDNIRAETVKGGNYLIPPSWGVQVTLSLEVDESSAINPGVTFINPLRGGSSQSLGLGATVSSMAQRTDKFNYFYTIADLNKRLTETSTCNDIDFSRNHPTSSSPFIVLSDLGIFNWLRDAMSVDNVLPSSVIIPGTEVDKHSETTNKHGSSKLATAKTDFKPDTLSYEIKFTIITTGTATPSWKLVRLSANTAGASFLIFNRTRIHDLTLTIGPTTAGQLLTDSGRLITVPVPARQAQDSHLASQIGLSVANNLRSSQIP